MNPDWPRSNQQTNRWRQSTKYLHVMACIGCLWLVPQCLADEPSSGRIKELSGYALRYHYFTDRNRQFVEEHQLNALPVQTVRAMLKSENPALRRFALVLSPLHDFPRDLLPDVIEAIKDEEDVVRVAALHSLPMIDPDADLTIAERILDSEEPDDDKSSVIHSLAKYSQIDEVGRLLSKAYKSKSVVVRSSVVSACEACRSTQSVNAILKDALLSREEFPYPISLDFVITRELRVEAAEVASRMKPNREIMRALETILRKAEKATANQLDAEFLLYAAAAYYVHSNDAKLATTTIRKQIPVLPKNDSSHFLRLISILGAASRDFENDVLDIARRSDDDFEMCDAIHALIRMESSSDQVKEFLMQTLSKGRTAREVSAAAVALTELFPNHGLNLYEAILSSSTEWTLVLKDYVIKDFVRLSLNDKSQEETVTKLLAYYQQFPQRREFLVKLLTHDAFEHTFWRLLKRSPEEMQRQVLADVLRSK